MSDIAAARLLTLAVEHCGDVVVVRCSGRLVSGTNSALNREVIQLIPGPRRIVLDFADLTHMDSVGLGTLVRLYVSARSAGCALELDNVGKSVRQLLGVSHLLSVFSSVGENCIKMG